MFDDTTHPLQILRTGKVNYLGKLENSKILVAKHATELCSLFKTLTNL